MSEPAAPATGWEGEAPAEPPASPLTKGGLRGVEGEGWPCSIAAVLVASLVGVVAMRAVVIDPQRCAKPVNGVGSQNGREEATLAVFLSYLTLLTTAL
jgi:hypothetical protein